MNCNNNMLLILLIFIMIYCLYKINKLENKENFNTDATTTAINTAVKKIYLADVEAIRILSNFAIQLSQGGTTIAGNVNIDGQLTTKNVNINGQLYISSIINMSDTLYINSSSGNPIAISTKDNSNNWLINNYPDGKRLSFRANTVNKNWGNEIFRFWDDGTLECNKIKCKVIEVDK